MVKIVLVPSRSGLGLRSVLSQSPCSSLPCPFAVECVEMGALQVKKLKVSGGIS